MIRLAADENFNSRIVRGLQRRVPDIDVVRIQDTGIYGTDDPAVLEWAAREGRVLLTHDARTVPRFTYERIQAGKSMPGVLVASDDLPVGLIIEDLVLLVLAGTPEDLDGQVKYLPL